MSTINNDMKLIKYTLEQLKDAVATSVSIRQCLSKLNIAAAGGNYTVFHKAVAFYKIDTSHFTGMNITGRKLPNRRNTIDSYLVKGSTVQSSKLKKYLLEANIFEKQCSCCGLTEWLGEPIPIELDHIDGCPTNNELSNLRLLCPNCHAKTPTYRGKNKRK